MNNDKKALGKGLSALISDATISLIRNNQVVQDINSSVMLQSDKIVELPVNNIEANFEQPRKAINNIEELAESVSKHGILQPILVRRGPGDKFQIIAGERRWRAAKLANFVTIPAIIKDNDEKTLFEISIIENIQREDLKPLEEAEAYSRLIENFGYTQENLSSRLGKSRVHVTNMLRLLKLPREIKKMIEEEKISAGHARAIINSEEPLVLAEQVVKKQLSVRKTEELARVKKSKVQAQYEPTYSSIGQNLENVINLQTTDVDLQQIEESISSKLEMKAKVIMDGDNSYIVIKPNNIGDIEKFLNLLNKD
ncbi:MAG: ParB/RepB/Spo0J family partition protein [Candidatus Midichloria sp.]|uniref:ParB/RepB/Spo0J family partition protein n=1 Tax=Hyalomma marginatum TaxID=34627 RepID=A0A8S4BWN9_9ACAR|nr:ParB/RepB/Spo0J family partition protein [Hyalomma marginatum]CAG7594907.1 ParB/RepB/Spo0J family partition protein [Hyalomma marginatum]